MLNRYLKYSISACLLLCLFLCEHRQCSAALPEPQRAIATITFTVRKDTQEEFIQRLRKFAEARAFATRVVQYGDDNRHYLIEFWRGDVNVTVINPFGDIRHFSLYIYRTGQTPVPSADLDALVSDIQGVINDVRDVAINSVKKSNE